MLRLKKSFQCCRIMKDKGDSALQNEEKNMRAVNINAGIGTLTRAFQQQGVEIVWAQESSEMAARVYQYHFPDIPLYNGELQEADISRIPEFDLLLASVRAPRFSIAQPGRPKRYQHTEIQKYEAEYLEKFIIYRQTKGGLFYPARNSLGFKARDDRNAEASGIFLLLSSYGRRAIWRRSF